MHITYQREVKEGDRLRITTQLIDFDAKRMHFIQCMYHAEHGFLGQPTSGSSCASISINEK